MSINDLKVKIDVLSHLMKAPNGDQYKKIQTPGLHLLSGPGYRYWFRTSDGLFIRSGETKDSDPVMSPVGPEILDIEVSTICTRGCPWCYKSNTGCGENMSFDTFKSVFDNIPKTLTQIAFGIGDLEANPDLWDMFKYCRENGVVPNVTIHGRGLTDKQAAMLATYCGAVAVSHYDDDECFNAIDMLYDAGLRQINIHKLLSENTYDECVELVEASKNIDALKAIVFLALKQKGRGKKMERVKSLDKISALIDLAATNEVGIGFDSCSAPNYFTACGKNPEFVEPCESGLFSFYVNVNGQAFPCSFSEGTGDWSEGIDLTHKVDFINDVWYNQKVELWRERLLMANKGCSCKFKDMCRSCPIYDVSLCKED